MNLKKGAKGFQQVPLAERFWAKVDIRADHECWLWQGAIRQRGYGTIYVKGRSRPAHQVAWEIHNGKAFPTGKMACHSCDNPPCVNPHHIWPGTMSDNIRDACEKGRLTPPAQREGWVSHNKLKTHCKRGHELSGDNLIVRPSGRRGCRACNSAIWSNRKHEHKARRHTLREFEQFKGGGE